MWYVQYIITWQNFTHFHKWPCIKCPIVVWRVKTICYEIDQCYSKTVPVSIYYLKRRETNAWTEEQNGNFSMYRKLLTRTESISTRCLTFRVNWPQSWYSPIASSGVGLRDSAQLHEDEGWKIREITWLSTSIGTIEIKWNCKRHCLAGCLCA